MFVFFKHSYHANPGNDKKLAGSNSYTLRDVFLKFSNTSASIKYRFVRVNRDVLQNLV